MGDEIDIYGYKNPHQKTLSDYVGLNFRVDMSQWGHIVIKVENGKTRETELNIEDLLKAYEWNGKLTVVSENTPLSRIKNGIKERCENAVFFKTWEPKYKKFKNYLERYWNGLNS